MSSEVNIPSEEVLMEMLTRTIDTGVSALAGENPEPVHRARALMLLLLAMTRTQPPTIEAIAATGCQLPEQLQTMVVYEGVKKFLHALNAEIEVCVQSRPE